MKKTTKRTGRNPAEGQVRRFATERAWANWLEKNFDKSRGVWLRLAKKGSGVLSVRYGEALDAALCYGWITGQAKGDTEKTWLAQFTPRSENSIWSRINREKALALIARGRMKPAGLEAIERAKRNGRWKAAYDSPRSAGVPEDLQAALNAKPHAREFFERLDSANRYAILFRIQTVKKAETRARKIQEFVEMLKRKETLHPPRPRAQRRGRKLRS
jgi:uncharacterized protein YdeI (YjbR/CyaY-like superfamily)